MDFSDVRIQTITFEHDVALRAFYLWLLYSQVLFVEVHVHRWLGFVSLFTVFKFTCPDLFFYGICVKVFEVISWRGIFWFGGQQLDSNLGISKRREGKTRPPPSPPGSSSKRPTPCHSVILDFWLFSTSSFKVLIQCKRIESRVITGEALALPLLWPWYSLDQNSLSLCYRAAVSAVTIQSLLSYSIMLILKIVHQIT
jgi:hypothetical protein